MVLLVLATPYITFWTLHLFARYRPIFFTQTTSIKQIIWYYYFAVCGQQWSCFRNKDKSCCKILFRWDSLCRYSNKWLWWGNRWLYDLTYFSVSAQFIGLKHYHCFSPNGCCLILLNISEASDFISIIQNILPVDLRRTIVCQTCWGGSKRYNTIPVLLNIRRNSNACFFGVWD